MFACAFYPRDKAFLKEASPACSADLGTWGLDK